jgi:hypothetical protein
MSQNDDIEFSDRHINMSELLALDGHKFNDRKRNIGQFINNAITALS